MAWDKTDDETLSFECDSCAEVVDLNVDRIREMAFPEPKTPDFCMCWRYLQGIGWRSFKRIGRDWTYHCAKCGPEAETAHNEWRRQENERERIRSRNRRD